MEAVSPKPARLSLVHGEKRPKPVCMKSCGPKIEEKQPGRKVPGPNSEELRGKVAGSKLSKSGPQAQNSGKLVQGKISKNEELDKVAKCSVWKNKIEEQLKRKWSEKKLIILI